MLFRKWQIVDMCQQVPRLESPNVQREKLLLYYKNDKTAFIQNVHEFLVNWVYLNPSFFYDSYKTIFISILPDIFCHP